MQFIDLAAQQKRIRSEIETRLKAVLDHGQYVMGPEVGELETRLAAGAGVRRAVACSSGTDALLMALMAFDVGPGDAVFTTPFTFIATAEVVSLLGAAPVFVDIDPRTFNMDPEKLDQAVRMVIRKGGLAPRGIIGVDLFGLPAQWDEINAIARANGLFAVEDAAQSFGATYKGRKAGSLADVAGASFFPAKPLGCYGDGGAVFTDDDVLAEKLVSIRQHGQGADKYENIRIGLNGRLDTFQAAVLLAKLGIFPDEVDMRQAAARRYTDLIQAGTQLVPPTVPPDMKSVWAQYSVLAADAAHRNRCMAALKAAGLPCAVYYPAPLHLQKAYAHLGGNIGDFPVSEAVAGRIFSLPMHPYLEQEDQVRIIDVLSKVRMTDP